MLLSKKDTPKPFHGMYYAGIANILVACINLMFYVLGASVVSLITSCFSLGVAVTLFLIIKRMTYTMLMDKLTKDSRGAFDGAGSAN